jgi:hypothetical protein
MTLLIKEVPLLEKFDVVFFVKCEKPPLTNSRQQPLVLFGIVSTCFLYMHIVL